MSKYVQTMPVPSEEAISAPAPDTLVEAVRKDLDGRSLVGADAKVVESRKVTWNDGSLGCPAPGVSYTQAKVEGWQVIVEVGGQQYDYRFAGEGGTPTLCESPVLGTPSNTNE